jgi:hypothetical protein
VRYELALRSSNRRFKALLDKKIEGVTITAPIIEGNDAGGRVEPPQHRLREAGDPRRHCLRLCARNQTVRN